ncbi:bifunctional [glutamine synthetase] adenylyltransferase/[glutamine synthetase]-adenylyl-L-tyrosine phosphorylase [Corynebacterium sp. TAE3-ERU12]|uniref:bifunctional [glutamine synthetase] adenylyltransferase/[glutamine synthetase]-adenylyl-L-tyrosine phosphorylase n=1 Tax=Corynebacterium sp. TAE3-ERU12 TaxID=2849491 RepID=UPI001C491B0F|nr:bifunctional [glutamine synthetase] adenylyltransferase/[glutamine synthetase]-adenylyl-L-tyrosine phosphorylase [Corynebacterium sp. TAE3-ERU12]MBV7295817.1 bifunctional [glutamine synthetase] adenylyltransferase/[glutamine synthetase]-adenylyl-L-tyrosine phosphorylase [Corynebacterium sp. TAE3-ERU12]
MSNRPRTSRSAVPTPAQLGLDGGERARTDLRDLGWYDENSLELLWGLAGASDPNLALTALIRLKQQLHEPADEDAVPTWAQWDSLDAAMRNTVALRTRIFALLGGSTALGDHLIANPTTWTLLMADLPTRGDLYREMLTAVEASPEEPELTDDDSVAAAEELDARPLPESSPDLEGPGLYRAGLTGVEAERAMKRSYRNLMMRIAAADLAGTSPRGPRRPGQPPVPFRDLTRSLSDLADAALTASLAVAVATTYPNKPVSTRLAVLAMGKCGAQELNYISDVDVIFVAEPADNRATRLASEFIRVSCKCFFEVDAALRPEGKSGALVRTLDSHVAYYKRWAHTWEFQALLKARPMTGDMTLARDYVDTLSPMVWTASQRDSFVEDVQAMRLRVIDNVPEDMRSRELKLGPGGLRDVEFAVQLLQMVHGRYDESLRVTATVEALDALIEGGFIGRDDGSSLIECYELMRLLEHRLQLQKMRRTHTLPAPDDEACLRWLSRSAGVVAKGSDNSVAALNRVVKSTAVQIRSLHNKLFYRPLLNSVVEQDIGTLQLSAEAAKRQLAVLGYNYPDRAFEHLTALASGGSRKARIQAMLLPTLMEWLSGTPDPDAGLLNYRKLSDALHEKPWFLRMLRDEGIVGRRLMHVLGTSPYVSKLLLTAPDSVKLFGDGANGPKLREANPETVSRSLVSAAARHSDPDRAIAVARALRRAELARVASADMLGMMDVREVCDSLSKVWDAVLEAALSAEIRGWQLQHPDEPVPAAMSVIGMGRLGGAELGYGSDADVMMVCDVNRDEDGNPVVDESDAVRWATGICDRLRRRLAKPSQDPPLEVDLDLRPEGRSGATVRTLDSYVKYYQRWGETWELQALLRATWIAGDRDLGIRFLHAIDPLRYPEQGASAKTVQEVRRMKARVDNERLPRGANRRTHTKLGYGALTDIEWTVQLLTLQHAHTVPGLHETSTLKCLDALEEAEVLSAEDVADLRDGWLTATRARNALVLARGKRTDQLPQPGPQLAPVAGAAGWDHTDSAGFMENYLRVSRHARRVVDRVFWGEEDPGYH